MLRTLLIAAIYITTPFITFSQHQHQHDEGIEVPLPDSRLILTQDRIQESMSLAKAHQGFREFVMENSDWNFRYDPMRRTPHRAWGRGIPIDGFPTVHMLNAPQAGRRFLEHNARAMNLDPAKLSLLYSEVVSGKIYQKYRQVHQGIDVLFSDVDLRISDHGKVFMFGSDYHQGLSVDTQPGIGREAALEFSKAGLPYVPSSEHITGGELYILPLRFPDRIDYRLVYNFQLRTSSLEHWDTYVDAHTGDIRWRRNLVHHFHGGDEGINGATNVVNGRVLISIYPESYTLPAQTVPLKNAYVWVSGNMYTTDEEGRFTANLGGSTTGQLITRLSGPYAISRRADTTRVSGGTPANAMQTMTVASGQEVEILWDNANSIASERNTFYHTNLVRDFVRALDLSPSHASLDAQVPGIVEINNQCNAFFDGSKINFFKSGLQCGNTGEISSVIHHEYGHGIHIWLTVRLTGRPPINGAIKEAVADLVTNLLRDDARIGVGFLKTGGNNGIIRNSDNTRRYPEDVINEIHDDGMILTGAVWDVRKAIGLDRTTRLFLDALYGMPDGSSLGEALADYFIEFLVADDDDGDLSNGTPNSEAIIAAFKAHGIPGSAILVLHDGITDQHSVSEGSEITGIARIAGDINPAQLYIEQVDVVYSTNDWQSSSRFTVDYQRSTNTFLGHFPPQPAGTIVRYYIEAFDNFGSSLRDPMHAPQSTYLYLVGFESRYLHDAETGDDWRVYGDATTGQWVREEPIGTWNSNLGDEGEAPWVQPNEDHTPGEGKLKCWVTGNAPRGSALGVNDIDDGSTFLHTREFDLTGMIQPVLRYYRWYTNDAGASPGQDYWSVQISSNGGSSWEYLERTMQSDASWKPYVFVLADIIDLTENMTVRFVASDDDPGSLVEAAVDDFELLDVNMALVNAERPPLASTLALEQNYPNPFNPSTTISFSLPHSAEVRLNVYNSLGQLIRTLVDARLDRGRHSVAFDARDLPTGMYMYELRGDNSRLSRKMMLIE